MYLVSYLGKHTHTKKKNKKKTKIIHNFFFYKTKIIHNENQFEKYWHAVELNMPQAS